MESAQHYTVENREPEVVKAKPEHIPKPTYWPFFTALGLMFMGWGLLSFWLFSVVGFVVFVISLIGWINLMRHE